jgi:hypothetical protein
MYLNVSSGQLDVNDNDVSALKRVNSTTYEAFTDRWIYETDASGISPNNTIICSGIYIDGVFQPKNSGTYNPIIDFNKGRVIFATGVASSSVVQAEFSYKHVVFEYPDSKIVRLLFSMVKNNVDYTPHAYPSGNQRQLPLVVIDLQKKTDRPFAFGGSKEHKQLIVFHVLTNNSSDLDYIMDILSNCSRTVIKSVDFNKVPQLLTYQGDKANTYKNFTQLQNTNNYRWSNLYIDEATEVSKGEFGPLFRGRVDWNITIYR